MATPRACLASEAPARSPENWVLGAVPAGQGARGARVPVAAVQEERDTLSCPAWPQPPRTLGLYFHICGRGNKSDGVLLTGRSRSPGTRQPPVGVLL